MPKEKTNTTDTAAVEVIRGTHEGEPVEYHGPPIDSPEAKAWICGFDSAEMIFEKNLTMGDVTYEVRRCMTDSEHVNMVPLP